MYCPYLGGSGWPAYPSCFHDTEGIDETQARPSHSISHHTVWPKEVVILPAHSDESWSELETSPMAEPVVLWHSALPISNAIQPDSLEVDQSLLRVRGLSIAVLKTLSQSRSVSMKRPIQDQEDLLGLFVGQRDDGSNPPLWTDVGIPMEWSGQEA